jgi:hypothetical protein
MRPSCTGSIVLAISTQLAGSNIRIGEGGEARRISCRLQFVMYFFDGGLPFVLRIAQISSKLNVCLVLIRRDWGEPIEEVVLARAAMRVGRNVVD